MDTFIMMFLFFVFLPPFVFVILFIICLIHDFKDAIESTIE